MRKVSGIRWICEDIRQSQTQLIGRRRSSLIREELKSSVKGEFVSACFVTDDYQCLSELIATVKGEFVGTFVTVAMQLMWA